MKFTAILTILIFSLSVFAAPTLFTDGIKSIQAVSIGDSVAADSKSLLDIKSTTKGVLFPRMTTTQMNAISSPTTGLMIWNTTAGTLYQYTGSAWAPLDGYPSQSGNSGKYLTTNGTVTSWATVDALPSQTGNSGKLLTTNGTSASWLTATDVGLPTQTGNSGKFLQTDGTNTSWATAALTVQGQDEGSGVTTTTLKAPYNQLTTTGTNERLHETGYNNLLANPSFEHSSFATSWAALGDTTPTAETTEIRHGKKSAKLTLNAQSGCFWSQSVTPTIKMSRMGLEHSLNVKTSLTGIKVCALQAGSVVGTCTTVPNVNDWDYYPATSTGPSSGSVGVALCHDTGATGDVYVDEAYVGKNRNIGTVAQARSVGSAYFAQTASCTWTRTNTALGAFGTTAACPGPTVESNSGPGTIQTTDTDLPKVTVNNLPAGEYTVIVTGATYGGAAANLTLTVGDGTTTSGRGHGVGSITTLSGFAVVGHFSYSTAGNRTFELQGSASTSTINVPNDGSNEQLHFEILYFPTSSQTVVQPNLYNWRVDANVGGGNPDLGLSALTSYTGIEHGSLTLTNNTGNNTIAAQIPCSSTNAPSGTTCSSGNESVGVSFTLPAPVDVMACASFNHYIQLGAAGSQEAAFQIVETPSNAQTISQEGKTRIQSRLGLSAAGDSITPFRVCGNFTFSSGGQKTLRLMREQIAASGTVSSNLILADNNTNQGQRDIHWEVYPLNSLFNTPLLVQSVIASDNSNGVTTINTVVSKSADYTATVNEETILVDSSGATRTITLPAAASVKGKKYELIQTSSTNQVIIDPNASETVCGQTTIRLSGLRDSVVVQSDGTNWQGLNGSCEATTRAVITFSSSTTACSITSQGGTWIASVASPSSQRCNLTLSTFFSTGVYCTLVSNIDGISPGSLPNVSNSIIQIRSNGATDGPVSVICRGQR